MKQTLKTMLALLALAIPTSLCAKTVYVYGTNSQKSMTVSSVRHVTFENGKLNLVHHDGSIEQTNLSSTRIFTLRDLGTTAVDEISGDKNANVSIKSYDNNGGH